MPGVYPQEEQKRKRNSIRANVLVSPASTQFEVKSTKTGELELKISSKRSEKTGELLSVV